MLVEVNKDGEGTGKVTQTVLRVVRRDSGRARENFDEIITEKREDVVQDNAADNKQGKEKGFSIQRAWCCLMSRRTS